MRMGHGLRMLATLAFLMLSMTAQAMQVVGLEDGVRQLASQISGQMKQRSVQKIAVDDFTDLGGQRSALGDFVAEELVTNFYGESLGAFEVVERRELARVLKEQELSATGLVSKESIAKIGEILGIDAIVTGSIADLGRDIKINARIIGVEDARVFAAAAVKAPKDEMVDGLMAQRARSRVGGMSSVGARTDWHAGANAFTNDLFSVTPTGFVLEQSGNLRLSLEIINHSERDLFLQIRESTLVNALGQNAKFLKYTGIHVDRGSDFTRIPAGGRIFGSMLYESNGEVEDQTFVWNAEFRREDGNKRHSLGVNFPDLTVLTGS